MDSDQKFIQEILSLDDKTLSEGILRVASGMGVDPKVAGMYLGDMGKIRQAVSSLTPEDLGQIRKNLGEEKVNDIISNIRRDLGEG